MSQFCVDSLKSLARHFFACQPAFVIAVLAALTGCSPAKDVTQNQDTSQRTVAQAPQIGGVPLELLKPKGERQGERKPTADAVTWEAKRPHVYWLIDGKEVRRVDPPVEPAAFRIDFDENKPLTLDMMPYAFMTEKSRQIVVRRGDVGEPFREPRINDGERITFIYYCENRNCPRIHEVQDLAMFPWDTNSQGPPVCPFCGSIGPDGLQKECHRYWMPQQLNMADAMRRQLYQDRRRAKN